MIITKNLADFFTFQAISNQKIGFHSTVLSASYEIEKSGFLPDKIFSETEHNKLLNISIAHKEDTSAVQEWLALRSVTFTQHPNDAIKHIKQGSSGGQGLKNLVELIQKLSSTDISDEDRTFIDSMSNKIQKIRSDQSVSYIVNLSDLGQRLDNDHRQPFYHHRWHPKNALPKISEIGPERILLKLIH
jgi:hypothetical protein